MSDLPQPATSLHPSLSESPIAWQPTPAYIARSRLYRFMQQHGISTFAELLERSTHDIEWFWDAVVHDLDLQWYEPYTKVLDLSNGIEWPHWFVGGKYNYVRDAVDKWVGAEEGRSTTDDSSLSAHRPTLTNPQSAIINYQLSIVWEGEDGEVRSLTYIELQREVNRAANALRALGIERGDRVGIYMPMIPETAVATLAVSKIGAIYIPIFSGYGGAAVAGRLRDCEAKLLITADGFYRAGKRVPMKQAADEAAASSPSVKRVLVVKRLGGYVSWYEGRDLWWHELLDSQSDLCDTEQTGAEDPYMIIYTSGTTGRPKGVVHVHSGFPLKAAQELAHCFDLHAGERLFWVSDIGWMMGPWSIVGALMLGATCFLYEGAINFPQPDRLWSLVERHRITHLGVSPTAIRSLMGMGDYHVIQHDLSSLVVLAGAGEPWNPAPWDWYFRVVGGSKLPLINYSGGTETSGGILACNTLLPIKPCAFSAPVPGMAADVIDENGRSVRGAVGELALRRSWPGITRGFWGDRREFGMRNGYLDTYWSRVPGVWVHGDWALVDDDGFWHILGRSDDTIKVAGKRIGPAEVESAAIAHPAVLEAAAIGAPDELKGEALVLFVRLRPGHAETKELRAAIEQIIVAQLGKSLKPRTIHVVPDLPHTRNGKILRRLVRQSFLGEPLGDLSALENPDSLRAIAENAQQP
jgi:acetyl-CoA synthetase